VSKKYKKPLLRAYISFSQVGKYGYCKKNPDMLVLGLKENLKKKCAGKKLYPKIVFLRLGIF
jgi:hypothetical protein